MARSDKLFHKRKAREAKDLARRQALRNINERILIVCEGGKTEPKYLRRLAEDLGLTSIDVEIYGENDPAPISVVNFAFERFKEDGDFDTVFCVFDKDSHDTYDQALTEVNRKKQSDEFKGKKLSAITSVPCFEFWYLLHFEASTAPYTAGRGKSPCENLIAKLKKKKGFKGYEKGKGNHYDLLKPSKGGGKEKCFGCQKAGQGDGDR